MVRNDFPDEVDEDGEVKVPFELHLQDRLDPDCPDLGGHTPCHCNPEESKVVRDEIKDFFRLVETKSDWLEDPQFRIHLGWLYCKAKFCGDCIDENLLREFEDALDRLGILPD